MQSVPLFKPEQERIDKVFLIISLTVFSLHIVILCLSSLMSTSLPPMKSIPEKLIVKTINLSDERVIKTENRQQNQVIAPPQKEIAPLTNSEVSPSSVEAKEIKKEIPKEPEPIIQKDSEKPKALEKPKKEVPKKTEVKKLDSKKKIPTKVETKPQLTKKNPPKAKQEIKSTQQKKSTEAPKPSPKAKQAEGSKNAPKADLQKAKQRELIAKAQKNIANIGKDATHKGIKSNSDVGSVVVPGAISSLYVESINTTGENLFTTQERDYYDELASRLKLLLRLPEYGEVKIKLTLERSGQFIKLAIVTAQSKKNREYIEQMLPTLKFPSFGDNFNSKSQHTFLINLSNDL